jgi:general secretion pathway protein K
MSLPARALPAGPAARQRGAALLLAMLILALIATLSTGMVWQQWRAVQVESAERARSQSAWILVGALDWARLILREDKAGIDHLGEPWAVPLAEARLSSFLAAGKDGTTTSADGDNGPEAFLSGVITDAQARYNLNNLVAAGKAVPAEVLMLRRLFENIGVAPDLATTITVGLRDAGGGSTAEPSAAGGAGSGGAGTGTGTGGTAAGTGAAGGNGNAEAEAQLAALNLPAVAADPPLLPQSIKQLRWFGLDEETIARITPHVILLPGNRRTTVNLNTASRELIAASIDKLDLAGAQRLVQARERKAFESLAEASAVVPGFTPDSSRVGVASDYFEVRGRLRLGDRLLEERSLVWRNQRDVQTLSRERLNGQDKLP